MIYIYIMYVYNTLRPSDRTRHAQFILTLDDGIICDKQKKALFRAAQVSFYSITVSMIITTSIASIPLILPILIEHLFTVNQHSLDEF